MKPLLPLALRRPRPRDGGPAARGRRMPPRGRPLRATAGARRSACPARRRGARPSLRSCGRCRSPTRRRPVRRRPSPVRTCARPRPGLLRPAAGTRDASPERGRPQRHVDVAAGAPARGPPPVPATGARLVARAPGRGPGRGRRATGAGRRCRDGVLLRRGGGPGRGHRPARREACAPPTSRWTGAAAVGTTVRRGDRLGTLSAAPGHCQPLACLHWGAVSGDTYRDPLALLDPGHPVLLPLR